VFFGDFLVKSTLLMGENAVSGRGRRYRHGIDKIPPLFVDIQKNLSKPLDFFVESVILVIYMKTISAEELRT
jgi:hypothetical protein